jgi:rhodanese-related sulfurtransferase
MQELEKLDKNKAYYIYCRTGSRSANTCELMKEIGFAKTYNLLGGITEWEGEVEGQNK